MEFKLDNKPDKLQLNEAHFAFWILHLIPMSFSATFSTARAPVGVASRTRMASSSFMGNAVGQRVQSLVAKPFVMNKSQQISGRSLAMKVYAVKDGTPLDRPLRVAVIGGGPSGACAAETLAKGGVETFLIERKMDNCKVRRFKRVDRIDMIFLTCGGWAKYCLKFKLCGLEHYKIGLRILFCSL